MQICCEGANQIHKTNVQLTAPSSIYDNRSRELLDLNDLLSLNNKVSTSTISSIFNIATLKTKATSTTEKSISSSTATSTVPPKTIDSSPPSNVPEFPWNGINETSPAQSQDGAKNLTSEKSRKLLYDADNISQDSKSETIKMLEIGFTTTMKTTMEPVGTTFLPEEFMENKISSIMSSSDVQKYNNSTLNNSTITTIIEEIEPYENFETTTPIIMISTNNDETVAHEDNMAVRGSEMHNNATIIVDKAVPTTTTLRTGSETNVSQVINDNDEQQVTSPTPQTTTTPNMNETNELSEATTHWPLDQTRDRLEKNEPGVTTTEEQNDIVTTPIPDTEAQVTTATTVMNTNESEILSDKETESYSTMKIVEGELSTMDPVSGISVTTFKPNANNEILKVTTTEASKIPDIPMNLLNENDITTQRTFIDEMNDETTNFPQTERIVKKTKDEFNQNVLTEMNTSDDEIATTPDMLFGKTGSSITFYDDDELTTTEISNVVEYSTIFTADSVSDKLENSGGKDISALVNGSSVAEVKDEGHSASEKSVFEQSKGGRELMLATSNSSSSSNETPSAKSSVALFTTPDGKNIMEVETTSIPVDLETEFTDSYFKEKAVLAKGSSLNTSLVDNKTTSLKVNDQPKLNDTFNIPLDIHQTTMNSVENVDDGFTDWPFTSSKSFETTTTISEVTENSDYDFTETTKTVVDLSKPVSNVSLDQNKTTNLMNTSDETKFGTVEMASTLKTVDFEYTGLPFASEDYSLFETTTVPNVNETVYSDFTEESLANSIFSSMNDSETRDFKLNNSQNTLQPNNTFIPTEIFTTTMAPLDADYTDSFLLYKNDKIIETTTKLTSENNSFTVEAIIDSKVAQSNDTTEQSSITSIPKILSTTKPIQNESSQNNVTDTKEQPISAPKVNDSSLDLEKIYQDLFGAVGNSTENDLVLDIKIKPDRDDRTGFDRSDSILSEIDNKLEKELSSSVSNVVQQLLLTSHENFRFLPTFVECASARLQRHGTRVQHSPVSVYMDNQPWMARIGYQGLKTVFSIWMHYIKLVFIIWVR